MSRVTRIEFITHPACDPCKDAIRDLRPIAEKYKIPLVVKEAKLDGPGAEIAIPLTCIIKENERPVCIYGWDKDYAKDVEANL